MNKVILIGRLGKDAEAQIFGENKKVSLTLATTENIKKDGEWTEATTWHNIVVWGGKANYAEKLSKGTLVHIEGKISNRSYEKDGEKKYISEIIANDIQAYGGNNSSDAKKGASKKSNAKATVSTDDSDNFSDAEDEDFPF